MGCGVAYARLPGSHSQPRDLGEISTGAPCPHLFCCVGRIQLEKPDP